MSEEAFPFAFGDEAASKFKDRLKELMRAQQEAFEEVQAERPSGYSAGGSAVPGRLGVVQQAVSLAHAGLATLGPQASLDDAAAAMNYMFDRALTTIESALESAD